MSFEALWLLCAVVVGVVAGVVSGVMTYLLSK